MKTKRWAGFKGYLNQQETSLILLWATSRIEQIHGMVKTSPEHADTLNASLSIYEGIVLKLEGPKDGKNSSAR